jgi:cell wall-associated NlpC family hydrolase
MRRPRTLAAVALALVLAMGTAAPAGADRISDKKAEAARIADRIESLGDEAARLGEAYNGARLALQQAEQEVADAQAELERTQGQLAQKRSAMTDFALKAYVFADQAGGVVGLLGGGSIAQDAVQRSTYSELALGSNLDDAGELKALSQDLDTKRAVLEQKRERADAQAEAVAAAKEDAEQAQVRQKQELERVQGELAVLLEQERQRRAAEAAARARAAAARAQAALAAQANRSPAGRPAATPASPATGGGGGSSGGGGSAPAPAAAPAPRPVYNVPSASPAASIAVQAALSQVGVPYRFATASPGVSFDCSGLTGWAWAQAGVSMPHYSFSQAGMFPQVSRDQLQPGDLVFTSGLGHVGIYIGNGQYVHAPRTGDVVKVSNLNRLAMAVRPG